MDTEVFMQQRFDRCWDGDIKFERIDVYEVGAAAAGAAVDQHMKWFEESVEKELR
jgi:hypothetical protein